MGFPATASTLFAVAALVSPASAGDVQGLLDSAQAGSDANFRALLSRTRQREDFTAPRALRRILARRRVLRLHMGISWRRAEGRQTLSWWFPEIGLAQDVDRAREALRTDLRQAGFAAKESERGTEFSVTKGATLQRVEVQGPDRWVGGRQTACGLRLRWSVDGASSNAASELGSVLRDWPLLADARVDAEILSALSEETAEEVSLGGTWTRYYSWEVTFVQGIGREAGALQRRLLELLRGRGYLAPTKEEGYQRLHRPGTGSYALLYDADARGRVRLSFQPES